MLISASVVCFFLLRSSIPLYEWATVCFCVSQLKGIWVVSSFWWWWMKLLQISVYKFGVHICFHVSWVKISSSGTAESYIQCIFSFRSNSQTVFCRGRMICIPLGCVWIPGAPGPHQLGAFSVSILADQMRCCAPSWCLPFAFPEWVMMGSSFSWTYLPHIYLLLVMFLFKSYWVLCVLLTEFWEFFT